MALAISCANPGDTRSVLVSATKRFGMLVASAATCRDKREEDVREPTDYTRTTDRKKQPLPKIATAG